jgi:uncharacterized protein
MKTIVVKVKPNGKQNLVKRSDDMIEVQLTKAPEKGKANKQLIFLLSDFLKIKASQIFISSGQTSKIKKISILEK